MSGAQVKELLTRRCFDRQREHVDSHAIFRRFRQSGGFVCVVGRSDVSAARVHEVHGGRCFLIIPASSVCMVVCRGEGGSSRTFDGRGLFIRVNASLLVRFSSREV